MSVTCLDARMVNVYFIHIMPVLFYLIGIYLFIIIIIYYFYLLSVIIYYRYLYLLISSCYLLLFIVYIHSYFWSHDAGGAQIDNNNTFRIGPPRNHFGTCSCRTNM